MARLQDNAWLKRQDQVARDYQVWCQDNSRIAFPVSYDALTRFLSFKVVQNQSTKSLNNMVSALKNYSLRKLIEWLDDSSRYLLKHFVVDLEYHDTKPVDRARPATLEIIMQVVEHLNMSNSLGLTFALAMLIAHNGLLRAQEVFAGLKVKDIVWNHSQRYFTWPLGRTKTHRKGDPVLVLIADYKGVSAYQLLLSWFDMHNLWNHPEYYVLPKVDGWKGNIDLLQCETFGVFRYRLKKHFARLGVTEVKFSGHSFRAGAATDLFAANVSIQDVQKLGRWKSMAVLIYYRAEALKIARKASNAFAQTVNVYKDERRRRGC